MKKTQSTLVTLKTLVHVLRLADKPHVFEGQNPLDLTLYFLPLFSPTLRQMIVLSRENYLNKKINYQTVVWPFNCISNNIFRD